MREQCQQGRPICTGSCSGEVHTLHDQSPIGPTAPPAETFRQLSVSLICAQALVRGSRTDTRSVSTARPGTLRRTPLLALSLLLPLASSAIRWQSSSLKGQESFLEGQRQAAQASLSIYTRRLLLELHASACIAHFTQSEHLLAVCIESCMQQLTQYKQLIKPWCSHEGELLCTYYNEATLFSPGASPAGDWAASLPSHVDCCQACADSSKPCRSFTWDSSTKHCILFRDDPNVFVTSMCRLCIGAVPRRPWQLHQPLDGLAADPAGLVQRAATERGGLERRCVCAFVASVTHPAFAVPSARLQRMTGSACRPAAHVPSS